MLKRLTTEELTGLKPAHYNFVVEYLKDFAPRRAAEASGFAPETGYELLRRDDIKNALQKALSRRLEAADIDPEWVLMELAHNHQIARQQGKISASNTALGTIAKLAMVDAFAAEKVMMATDEEVMQRLQRARKRAVIPTDPDPGEVSFI